MGKWLIFLLFFAVAGCDKKDPFPANKMFVIDIDHQVVAEKHLEITSDKKLVFSHVQDLPIVNANGMVCFHPDDFLPVKKWTERQIADPSSGRK